MNIRVKNLMDNAFGSGHRNLLEPDAKTICKEYGIPIPRFIVTKNVSEATKAAHRIGYPVVMKIVSPDISHKTEAGGVLVNIRDPNQVRKAFKEIISNARRYKSNVNVLGILVQEMAPDGTQLIIGGLRDPQFGQTIMLGVGGIFAELYKDVTFRIAPITREDANEMLEEIRARPIIEGFRGQPPADKVAITGLLQSVSDLMIDLPQIAQLDLNPVIVYPRGASVVDARIILTNSRAKNAEPQN